MTPDPICAGRKSSTGDADKASFDPERPDFTPYGLTCGRWKPSPMRRPDHHNEIELNYLESGSLTYLLGARKFVIRPGQLSVFWAAVPHQIIDHGEEPSYYVATVPLSWFLQWRLPQSFVQSLLNGMMLQDVPTPDTSADCRLFSVWESDLGAGSVSVDGVLLEMHARLLRLTRNLFVEHPEGKSRDPMSVLSEAGLNKVERMACFIAQNYREKLTVSDVASAVKLHPNYAMRLFQKTFGSTLVNYLTQHRVSHAQRLLTTTNLTMVEVAFDSGFNSLSRFNDAFREVCGCAPRDYRRANHKGQP